MRTEDLRNKKDGSYLHLDSMLKIHHLLPEPTNLLADMIMKMRIGMQEVESGLHYTRSHLPRAVHMGKLMYFNLLELICAWSMLGFT